jgi:hypothetical protein
MRTAFFTPFVQALQAPLVDGGMGLSFLEAEATRKELLRFLALKARNARARGAPWPCHLLR